MGIALVTGAKGFIGRYLSRELANRGVKVLGLGHGAWIKNDFFKWGLDDYLNGEVIQSNLDQLASKHGLPDQVFHLAGGSSVGPSFTAPEEDFRRSVDSTFRLLEWTRNRSPQSKVVLASSAAIYGSIHTEPIAESSTIQPYSPYGYHKRITEILFESFAKNFGLSVGIVRLFSVYGPELRKQLLWDLCNHLKDSPQTLELQGSGQEERDWIHVEDAVNFLIRAAELSCHDNTFIVNGGTGIGINVSKIAKYVCHSYGLDSKIRFSNVMRMGDPKYLVANIDFAHHNEFVIQKNWKDGVSEYVNWFHSFN